MKATCRVLAIFAPLALVGSVLAGKAVPLDMVPEAAKKTIKDRFPKAEIVSVDKENTKLYEFVMKEGDRKFDLGVNADGKLVNVKEEIAEKDLPKAVKDGLLKRYADAKIVEIEKVTTGDGKDAKTVYEMAIKTEKGKMGVIFDAEGKQVGDTD